ncbi:hypothetical protein WNY59_15940 [Ahrensia kielensis]|uniref:MobA/VirD2-like nuclease domain-containing protein n=1 Tax=Ahrensia kielensis TaxID=76980 RepID=A0ABU9TAC3_9HYPH
MIIGFDPHDLSDALAIHLGSAQNGFVEVTTSGLASSDLNTAVKQLRLLATGARTLKPGVHAFMSPSLHYTKKQWLRAWELFEMETGLVGQPFVEVRHSKNGQGGRTADHIHRVYLRLNVNGRAIPISHCAPRAEKISRICEYEHGERLTSGRYNRSVIDRLNSENRADVAQAMVASHLHTSERPEATSRTERAQTERLQDMAADEAKRLAYIAWLGAENAYALEQRLLDNGLFLCRGDRGKAMIVTARGSAYRLAASIASGAKIAKAKGSVKAEEVHALIADLELCPIAEVRAQLTAAPAVWGRAAVTGADRSVPRWLSQSKEITASKLDLVERLRPQNNYMRIAVPTMNKSEKNFEDASILMKKETPHRREFSPEALEKAQIFIDALLGREKSSTKQASETHDVEGESNALIVQKSVEQTVSLRNRANENIETFAAKHPPAVELFGDTWRDQYKAGLAGVEKNYGHVIRWVDNSDGEPRKVFLKDKTILRAETTRISSSQDTDLAIEIMISFAIEQEMPRPCINGFSRKRCEEVARIAARRGLLLANEELQDVIADELATLTSSKGLGF